MAKPKEGDITIKEGNKFVYRNGKWYPEGKGEFGSQANTREANRALRELRQSKPIGYAARKKAERENAKESSKKSTLRGVSSTNDMESLRRGQEQARQAQLEKANRKPPAPKPEVRRPAASSQPARPATTAKPPATSAAPKERRVSASTSNRESGNYGTSRTNNPLMNDLKEGMRKREQRTGVGPVKDGSRYAADVRGTKTSSPADRSKYVAPNGKPYAGPAYGNGSSKSEESTMKPNKMADGKKVGKVDTPKAKQAKSLKEMMDERKKRYNSRTASYGGY